MYIHIQYHSCKSKFCTSCGNKYSKERVISITSKLYNCNHRHLVFTIHDALWNLFRIDRNRLNLLLEAVNLDLGSVWIGTAPHKDRMDYVSNIFNLKENLKPFCIIAVGYPLDENGNKFIDRFDETRIQYF